MKKIISFILALVMIASMAVVAFADDAAATTPTPVTINTAAADFDSNRLVTAPEAVAGKEGFETGLAVKFDSAQAEIRDVWTSPAAKAGDTLFIYYYVEKVSAGLTPFFWNYHDPSMDDGMFNTMDTTPGYHVAEWHIDANAPSISIHVGGIPANTDPATLDFVIYVGDIVIREGNVNRPELQANPAIPDLNWTADEAYAKAAQAEAGNPAMIFAGHTLQTAVVDETVKEALGLTNADSKAFLLDCTKASIGGSGREFTNWATFKTGYKYTITMDAYVIDAPSTTFGGLGWINSWVDFVELSGSLGATHGATTLTLTVTPKRDFNTFGIYNNGGEGFKAYIGDIRITAEPSVTINPNTSEYTFTGKELTAENGLGTSTDEGLHISPADWAACTESVGPGWGAGEHLTGAKLLKVLPVLDAYAQKGLLKDITIVYEVKGTTSDDPHIYSRCMWHGGDCPGDDSLPIWASTYDWGNIKYQPAHVAGEQTITFSNMPIDYMRQLVSKDNLDLYIKSVTVKNVGGNPVKATITPLDILSADNKVVMPGETADVLANLGETFTDDKVFVATIEYRIYAAADAANASVLTVGDQTVVLKRVDGIYTADVGITNGADVININAKDALVILGDVTYIEAGEDYKKLQDAITVIPQTLKLDKTLAQTPELAVAYIEAQLVELYGDKYDVVSVALVDSEDAFIPYADDASVAAAAAAANGSVTVEVSVVEKATALPCTMTLTFDIVAKTGISDYNAATGDSAIVAIVALIALVSLAGVVVAKKKVSVR